MANRVRVTFFLHRLAQFNNAPEYKGCCRTDSHGPRCSDARSLVADAVGHCGRMLADPGKHDARDLAIAGTAIVDATVLASKIGDLEVLKEGAAGNYRAGPLIAWALKSLESRP